MRLLDLFTKLSITGVLMAMAFMLQSGIATAQSRDENHPTPIAAFPVTGNLGSGTYYYEVAESAVAGGPATAVLDLTPPDGGGSMTVTFSGPLCCPPEAYLGVTTGLPDRIREATTFNISRQQVLLVTVYVSVAAKHTVRFTLNFTNGSPSSRGIIVTPPSPSPTPAIGTVVVTPPGPTPASGRVVVTPPGDCTDLAVESFRVVRVPSGNAVKFEVRNLSPTRFIGNRRLQWVEVSVRSDRDAPTLSVDKVLFTEVPASGSIRFTVIHATTIEHRQQYLVSIVYSPINSTDRLKTNDDCNNGNNVTARQLVDGGRVLELEEVP